MQILREGEENGVTETCRKYEIGNGLFYHWRNQFNSKGIEGLQGGNRPRVDPALKELEKENEALKKIVARQALELEVKNELLKKTRHLKR